MWTLLLNLIHQETPSYTAPDPVVSFALQVEPRQLAASNGRVADVLVGACTTAPASLRLGDLAGNLFTLVLREVPRGSRAAVRAAVDAVRRTGFLNYFGLQRFGQGTVPTHVVGAPPTSP